MAGFTRGPWIGNRNITGGDGTLVATINRPAGGNLRVENANAVLICHAPTMFDLCEQLLETVSSDGELNLRTAELTLLDLRTIARSVVRQVSKGHLSKADVRELDIDAPAEGGVE